MSEYANLWDVPQVKRDILLWRATFAWSEGLFNLYCNGYVVHNGGVELFDVVERIDDPAAPHNGTLPWKVTNHQFYSGSIQMAIRPMEEREKAIFRDASPPPVAAKEPTKEEPAPS